MTRILGIDPGSIITGYGMIEMRGTQPCYIASGSIHTAGAEFPDRLRTIHAAVVQLVAEHVPDEVVFERVFMNRNADSALKLGQARAAAICGTFARELPVHEYSAREVKQAIVGRGAAGKEQVQHMVKVLLKLQGEVAADAADALAVALCHGFSRTARARLSIARGAK